VKRGYNRILSQGEIDEIFNMDKETLSKTLKEIRTKVGGYPIKFETCDVHFLSAENSYPPDESHASFVATLMAMDGTAETYTSDKLE